ncbi:MAG: hypothetical protein IK002_09505 [Treponema sp.]|uniref:hypothetical protein n=1 Tax=Treponema sp. TaxID=166 RepID=UPI00298E479D|nr:hypothetical protein [Treponema sp.]MBR5934209.1 hypothetical protein [Treponema sp.]
MDRQNCKRHKAFVLLVLPLFGIILSLVSCENFYKPVKSWFKYYTDNATVGKYDIVEVVGTSSSGIQCIESNDNKDIKLYLMNPIGYSLACEYVFDNPEINVSPGDVCTFVQSMDKNVITLTFSQSFLHDVEMGNYPIKDEGGTVIGAQKDLSGTIKICTDDSVPRPFESFHISVIVNSAPPRMRDAMFQYNKPGDGKKYVVCFKIPDLNNTVHQKDTKTLVVNGETYNVSFGSSVSITPSDGKLKTEKPSDLCDLNNLQTIFTNESGYVNFYYYTGITPTNDRKTVNITLTDDYNFKTEVVVSNSTGKLIKPTLSVAEGNAYQVNETDGIYPVVINHTGESKKYNDEGNLVDGDRCSKPYISYKLYKDGVADPIKEDSGPAPLTVNLEKGKYYIETYAYADTFVDSDKASGFAAESTSMVTVKSPLTYYVKNTGSDIAGSGNGSKKKPYRTIQKCIDEIYADYNAYDHNTNTIHTVEMLSNLTAQDGDTFTNNAFIRFKEGTDNINKALNYVLEGHGYTINASQKGHVIMTVSNTIIGINNVNITGGITDSNFGYKNGGGILCAGGIVTMNAGSITGCHSCLFGGAVYVFYGKAITLNGVTITGNTADNAGGGVYIPSGHHDGIGYISLKGNCNITGNTAGDTANRKPSNIYLGYDDSNQDVVMKLEEKFTGRVGVTTEKQPEAGQSVVITKNFSANATGKPWERFFPDDPSQGVIIYNKPDETEAVLSVSSSLISAYNGEKIIVSCTETVNLNGSISVSVVDEVHTDITSQCTFVNRIIFYKSDPLIGSNYYTSNGNTVTLKSDITEKDIYVLFVQFRYKGFDYDARIPFRVQ